MTGPTILTIDDSSLSRRSITDLFQTFECRMLQAEDGLRGLAAIRKHRPDLVILDRDMPVMGGIEMLRELRADPDIAGIPVIMLTANVAPETLAQAARLGVRDFQQKPPDAARLIARAARLVTLLPRAGAISEPPEHD